MKNYRRFLLVSLILGILLTLTQTSQLPADTLTPDQIAEKARDSTVLIVSMPPGENFISSGSGFFVETDKIVTNIHVVNNETPKIKQVGPEAWYTIKGVIAFDVKSDMVILQIEEEGVKLPLGDSDTAQAGDPILAVGYPHSTVKEALKDKIEHITEAERWKVIKRTKVESKNMKGTIGSIRNSDKQLRLKASLIPGYSGGPVLNSEGEVIGISVEKRKVGDAYAGAANKLKVLLKQSEDAHPEPLSQWQRRNPIQAWAWFNRGQLKYMDGDYAEAITAFNQAIRLNSKIANYYNSRGLAKYSNGDYKGAIEDYEKAIGLIPDFLSPYEGLANAYIDQGDKKHRSGNYDAAVADFTKIIKELRFIPEWNVAAAYFNRGNVRKDRGNGGDYDAAIKDYDKALIRLTAYFKDLGDAGIKPDSANFTDFADRIYLNRGLAKFLLGKHEEIQGNEGKARNLYEDAIKDCWEANVRSKDAQSYYYLGLAYEAQRKDHLAHENFTRAKELDLNNFLIWERKFERYRIR